jgi:hypothetical protein
MYARYLLAVEAMQKNTRSADKYIILSFRCLATRQQEVANPYLVALVYTAHELCHPVRQALQKAYPTVRHGRKVYSAAPIARTDKIDFRQNQL